ncbi:MAG: hypothetical protein H6500_00705 [Candidatus Woesearchaeota archaeon]|nr:hypothetical protein [Nanoarchaeota archaeon]USN44352.1 MAG: hypothetical protein H6500_00705 [Candidatus Woesearchaeota archaeon]
MVKNPRFLPFANYVGLSLLCPRRVAAYLFPKFNSLVGGIELQEFSVLEEVPLEELLPFLVGEARLSSFPKEVLDKQLRSRLLEQEGKDKSVREGTLYCNFNCLEQEGLDKYVRGGFFTDRKLHPAFFYSGFLLSSNRGERVYLSPFDVDTSPAPISVAPSQFKNLSSELSHLLGF